MCCGADSSHFVADAFTEPPDSDEVCYIGGMDTALSKSMRRPRFQRAAEPPAFRLTDDDVTIVRQIARYRFMRSTHVAALVGRSLDRTNDRLSRLFHAGYVDRPRAQLDYYPTSGSAPMVYALAERGALLLAERGIQFPDVEWGRRNREAGRPFIEHQLEIVDFQVALEQALKKATDVRLIHSDELIAAFPERTHNVRNPFALRVSISHNGNTHDIGLSPDLAFGLRFADGSRRCFMVEIDRGTMPISRSDLTQTSVERKMRAYLTAYAAKQHEQQFGWKAFRVLVVTTDDQRMRSMQETLGRLDIPNSLGASLFFFAMREELHRSDSIAHTWHDGTGRGSKLT
jgi:Replication-relaxation